MKDEGGVSGYKGRGTLQTIGGASGPKHSHTVYRLMNSQINFSVVHVNWTTFPQFPSQANKLIKISLSNRVVYLEELRRTLCFCLQVDACPTLICELRLLPIKLYICRKLTCNKFT